MIAEITADFASGHDPNKERCWIAEMGGEVVGSVFLVRQKDGVAKLWPLLAESVARGVEPWSSLIEECVRFALRKGYSELALRTNSVLDSARHVYEKKGFTLVAEEEHHSFGKDLVGQSWELEL